MLCAAECFLWGCLICVWCFCLSYLYKAFWGTNVVVFVCRFRKKKHVFSSDVFSLYFLIGLTSGFFLGVEDVEVEVFAV